MVYLQVLKDQEALGNARVQDEQHQSLESMRIVSFSYQCLIGLYTWWIGFELYKCTCLVGLWSCAWVVCSE